MVSKGKNMFVKHCSGRTMLETIVVIALIAMISLSVYVGYRMVLNRANAKTLESEIFRNVIKMRHMALTNIFDTIANKPENSGKDYVKVADSTDGNDLKIPVEMGIFRSDVDNFVIKIGSAVYPFEKDLCQRIQKSVMPDKVVVGGSRSGCRDGMVEASFYFSRSGNPQTTNGGSGKLPPGEDDPVLPSEPVCDDLNASQCDLNGDSTSCKSGFYLDGNRCSSCPSHATCSGGSSWFVCQKGYYHDGDSCSLCGDRYYTNTTGATECRRCPDSQKDTSNHTACTHCTTSEKCGCESYANGNGGCQVTTEQNEDCPAGQVYDEQQGGCVNCTDRTAGICGCSVEEVPDGHGGCEQACSYGQHLTNGICCDVGYRVNASGQCVECSNEEYVELIDNGRLCWPEMGCTKCLQRHECGWCTSCGSKSYERTFNYFSYDDCCNSTQAEGTYCPLYGSEPEMPTCTPTCDNCFDYGEKKICCPQHAVSCDPDGNAVCEPHYEWDPVNHTCDPERCPEFSYNGKTFCVVKYARTEHAYETAEWCSKRGMTVPSFDDLGIQWNGEYCEGDDCGVDWSSLREVFGSGDFPVEGSVYFSTKYNSIDNVYKWYSSVDLFEKNGFDPLCMKKD